MNQSDPNLIRRSDLDQFMDKLAARAVFRKPVIKGADRNEVTFDTLSFGTERYTPDQISHIDVLDAAGNRVGVQAVRRGMTVCQAADNLAVLSEIGLMSGLEPPVPPVLTIKNIGECWLSATEVEQLREAFDHLFDESAPRAASEALGKEDK